MQRMHLDSALSMYITLSIYRWLSWSLPSACLARRWHHTWLQILSDGSCRWLDAVSGFSLVQHHHTLFSHTQLQLRDQLLSCWKRIFSDLDDRQFSADCIYTYDQHHMWCWADHTSIICLLPPQYIISKSAWSGWFHICERFRTEVSTIQVILNAWKFPIDSQTALRQAPQLYLNCCGGKAEGSLNVRLHIIKNWIHFAYDNWIFNQKHMRNVKNHYRQLHSTNSQQNWQVPLQRPKFTHMTAKKHILLLKVWSDLLTSKAIKCNVTSQWEFVCPLIGCANLEV